MSPLWLWAQPDALLSTLTRRPDAVVLSGDPLPWVRGCEIMTTTEHFVQKWKLDTGNRGTAKRKRIKTPVTWA